MTVNTSCVKERPILFSGEMVRAIMDLRKTQTRRVVKFTQFGPSDTPGYRWTFRGTRRGHSSSSLWQDLKHDELLRLCPYGVRGDRLWVRETWRESVDSEGVYVVEYKADDSMRRQLCELGGEGDPVGTLQHPNQSEQCAWQHKKWRPSIHMPRWASRITLEITDVRVERLQDITNSDARDEGCVCSERESESDAFHNLWSSINGDDSWDYNPWVWVVSFVTKNS